MRTLLDEVIAETFGELGETPRTGDQELIYAPGRDYGWQKELYEVTEADTTQNLIDQGIRNENALTDRLFYGRHPALRGQKLIPGTDEAREWITIRNLVVRPKLAAVPLNIRSRPCCVLGPLKPVIGLGKVSFSSNSMVLDPLSLGTHQGADETLGILYTGGAGFMDLGHLREDCDLTDRLDQISGSGRRRNDYPDHEWGGQNHPEGFSG